MMKRTLITLILLIIVILAACQSVESADSPSTLTSPSPTETSNAPPGVVSITGTPTAKPDAEITEQTPAETVDAAITPEPTALPQTEVLTSYTLSVTLDYGWKTATVQQHIHYTNNTGARLSDIVLAVEPNRFPGAFLLVSLTLADGEAVIGHTLRGIQLNVPLIDSLGLGDELDLYIEYELILPRMVASEDVGPNPFGYSARQTNLTDWYPFVPPYEAGAGWLVHDPWYYGEHQVYPVADFDVELRILSAPEGTLVAASALALEEGLPYRYRLERGRNFAISVSYAYQVQQVEVDGVTLLGYHFQTDQAAGQAAFQAFVEAFTLYNELFSEYPYDSLTLVEADFNHGMEYQGLVFVSRGFYNLYVSGTANYLTAITAHETSHQWWYGLVASDQALEPWLDEALSTYSELLFYESIYPESLDWWWTYRIEFYEPAGLLDVRLYDSNGYRPYVNAVYLNGAKFLHELRQTIGDEDFFAFIRAYAEQDAHQIITTEDFFSTLAASTDVDINPVVDRYFQSQ
jgi:hypothetical protein